MTADIPRTGIQVFLPTGEPLATAEGMARPVYEAHEVIQCNLLENNKSNPRAQTIRISSRASRPQLPNVSVAAKTAGDKAIQIRPTLRER
jgi:hypothetical protein